jgi:hypothetical protein
MLSMVFDMSDDARLAFVRELAYLVICGLRERARVTADSGRRQLLTDACRAALILYLAVPLWGILSRLDMRDGPRSLIVLAICVVFALLLVGYNRWAGIGGLCSIAVGMTITLPQGQPQLIDALNPLVTMAVPALCCAVLAVEPGRRRPRLARLWWFVSVVVLAIMLPPSLLAGGRFMFGLGYQYAFLAAASAVGVVRLTYDPRLALGCGMAWASIALRMIYANIAFGFVKTGTSTIVWIGGAILTASFSRLLLMRNARPA